MQCNMFPVYIVYNLHVHHHHFNVINNMSLFIVRCISSRRKLQPTMKLRDGQTMDIFEEKSTYSTVSKYEACAMILLLCTRQRSERNM